MLNQFFTKMFGNRNTRVLARLWKIVDKVNTFEEAISQLDDKALGEKTQAFKQRIKDGCSLDSLLPEAFAVVREASKRTLNMRHFDVQMIGGMVLDGGNIAEMRTGEGKTLVATLAAYLNTLSGNGVHIVTVNDYLARRDAEWMRPLYEFLQLTVGINLNGMSREEKQQAYAADITYGTNNEFGFDYLRDNMVFSKADKVQRPLNYAIVDEVDSILIDEARTPLIISGAADESVHLYEAINNIIPELVVQAEKDGPGDFTLDEKSKQAYLTEDGHQRIEDLFVKAGLLKENESLYDSHNIVLMHHVNAALRAQHLFQRDVDYIVQNDEVVIVDEHTGRTMPGRRWSDGLHQAVEAKERVTINQENQTLASITFQNYFRLYNKLSGMTGTADTEAYEFQQIYGLEVIVIPTHKEMVRQDFADLIYMTVEEKFSAIVEDIKETWQTKQPVLVGTASIEASELLSKMLEKANIPHKVLNAKFHEKEAQIISEAGRPGAVTIATNMAGRGTDIVLGGNLKAEIAELDDPSDMEMARLKKEWQKRHDDVINSGGLYVLGSERHESRRIDNQLRGRSGRQGDPGKSRFYLSLQDNLLRIFGGERLNSIMQRIGMEEGVALESRMLSKSIENAQRKVEAYNFDVRKQLLEFDDVANEQRKVMYQQRNELLEADDVSELIKDIGLNAIHQTIDQFIPPMSMEEEWDIHGLEKQLEHDFNIRLNLADWLEEDKTVTEEQIRSRIVDAYRTTYQKKVEDIGEDVIKPFEKGVMLQTLDHCWREHLAAMEYLRQGIHLRGYAQKNPKQEYKRESFEMFAQLLTRVNHDVISTLMKFEPSVERSPEEIEAQQRQALSIDNMQYKHSSVDALHHEAKPEDGDETLQPFTREQPKVGRNEPCPCGSSKKYKVCHGKLS